MSIFSKPIETSTKPNLPDLNLDLTLTLDPTHRNLLLYQRLVTAFLQRVWSTSLSLQVSFPPGSFAIPNSTRFSVRISGSLNPTSTPMAESILDLIKTELFPEDSHPPIPTGRIFQGTLKNYHFDASFEELGIEYSVRISPSLNSVSQRSSQEIQRYLQSIGPAGTSMTGLGNLFGQSQSRG